MPKNPKISEEEPDDLTNLETGELTLSNIRYFVLGEDHRERKLLQKIDSFLKKELNVSDLGSEKRLACLFYAIITKTRMFSVETPEMRKLFRMFIEEMDRQIVAITHGHLVETFSENVGRRGVFEYFRSLFRSIEFRLRMLENKVRLNQMRAFLHLSEYYVYSLESIYKNLSMSDRVLELYVARMDIKKSHLFFEKKFGAWFGMAFFRGISTYGTSFGRLAVTCVLSIAIFGSVYWFADFFAPEDLRMIASLEDYSSYFFNSLVTISGLGIDASPQTAFQRIAMGINTIY
jgi:hypothetical protein